jgi:dTDP-4-amino-4,6-dideoxygalactose transaminase
MTKEEATTMLGAMQMLEVLIKPHDEVSTQAFTYVWNTLAQIAQPIN